MNRRSITVRLVAWYCGLVLLAGGAFAGCAYIGFSTYLRQTVRNTLHARADDVASVAMPLLGAPDKLNAVIEQRFLPEAHDRFIRIMLGHQLLYLSGAPAELRFDPTTVSHVALKTGHLVEASGLLIFRDDHRLPDGRLLVVDCGQSIHIVREAQHGLLEILLFGMPVLLIVAASGGYMLVGQALRPVSRMIAAAEALTFSSPHKRLPPSGTGDQIEELSRTLNRMLDRLDHAYQHVSRFSADAAHELRTPLTIMRGELEFVAGHRDAAPDIRTAAGSALEETLRLSQMVDNLMALAQAEGIGSKRPLAPLDLSALTLETIDQMQLLAEEKTIALTCDAPAPVWTVGDRSRLKQVLVNLIDNAIKYTAKHGDIKVQTAQTADRAVVTVADNGVGIDPAHAPFVFDRFYRVDPDRGATGAGLGLAIVKSICVAHGGAINVESIAPHGCRFRVSLPLGAPASPSEETV